MKKFFLLSALLIVPVAAQAQDAAPAPEKASDGSTLSVILENDSFIDHIDRHYTNGLYFNWTGAPETRGDDIAALAQTLMLPGADSATWRTSWFGGQSMYTPENLSAIIPPANDRPYAGWLYGGARLYRDSGDTLDSVEATLGMVGPASLAGDLQESWHQAGLFGGIYPNGWHYQLRDEPGLILGEQRTWRVDLSDGPLEAEILPEANVKLGNIFTYAGAGGMFRIGSGLKSDWGPPRIAPALTGADFQSNESFGWYFFVGFEGRAVARNIFLNGNSFEDGPRVSSKLLVDDLNGGAAVEFPGVRLMVSYTNRSKEFVTQTSNDQFVSINLSIAN